MKKYVVVERNRKFNTFNFINEGTTDLSEIWETHCPYSISENEKMSLKPLIFDNRTEAIKYKNKIQSDHNRGWAENGYIYKMYGDSKSKWRVEEYYGSLFM
jgi:hypothetical protein